MTKPMTKPMTKYMTKYMITPLFFPFSHMRKDQLKSVTAFFQKISFLPLVTDFNTDQQLTRLIEQDILQPIFLSDGEIDVVEKQVRSYQDWAQLHRGNEKNFRGLLQKQPYFTEDTGLSNIQSQIRHGTQKKEAPGESVDSVDSAEQQKKTPDPLLLLKFAEILDVQNEEIEDELTLLEQSKASLFSQLLGETPGKKSGKKSEKSASDLFLSSADDPGSIMTEERVVSWFRYSQKKGVFKGEGSTALLVTTSPAVLDFMVSRCEGVINGLDIDSIKVHENECEKKCEWQQDFYRVLETIMDSKSSSGVTPPMSDDTCSLTGSIRLCLFPGDSTKVFLNMPDQSIAVCLVKLKS